MSLTVQDGKLVVRNGALGTTQACCCGGGRPCEGPTCDAITMFANGSITLVGGMGTFIINEFACGCASTQFIWFGQATGEQIQQVDGAYLFFGARADCAQDGLVVSIYVIISFFGSGDFTDCILQAVIPKNSTSVTLTFQQLGVLFFQPSGSAPGDLIESLSVTLNFVGV